MKNVKPIIFVSTLTILSSHASAQKITDIDIFFVLASKQFAGITGIDERGKKYYFSVFPWETFENGSNSKCNKILDSESSKKAVPPIKGGYYEYKYFYKDWNVPQRYLYVGSLSKTVVEEYIQYKYGIKLKDISVKIMKLSTPQNEYDAYDVYGNVKWVGYTAKLSSSCRLMVNPHNVSGEYRFRFLDQGNQWEVLIPYSGRVESFIYKKIK